MLRLENVHTFYEAIEVLRGISIEVKEGEIVTIIGANGAGKTTTLKTIVGLKRCKEGTISFMGQRIDAFPAEKIVTCGISLVPEGRRVFPRLTVIENLQMGGFSRRKDKQGFKVDIDRMFGLFARLAERRDQMAETLSGGEQQMLAIARALMSRPKLLMLDEPSMGLAPIIVQGIFEIIRDINKDGTTVLLVEQNAKLALAVAHRAYVLQTGEILREGPAKELLADESVRRAYLGEAVYAAGR